MVERQGYSNLVAHLILWLGIATDALGRARAFVRASAKSRPDESPTGGGRLAGAAVELQSMKGNLASCLSAYEAAIGSEDRLSAISFAVAMNNLKLVMPSSISVYICSVWLSSKSVVIR